MGEALGAAKKVVVAATDIWGSVVVSLKAKLSNETFDTWFRLIEFHGVDHAEKKLTLRAPNEIVRNWVTTNFSLLLDQTLAELALPAYSISWMPETRFTFAGPAPSRETTELRHGDQSGDSDSQSRPVPSPADYSKPFIGEARPADAKPLDPSLNSKYSYDGFVVGSCNQFAHAASLAVAEAPGKTYNPLYIYGGVGLGKTHLMHACGHAIKQRNPHLRLCYLSSEKFMNELINAIRYDKTPAFRERYRSVDVLLIDDVQFMAGKERTQEEFFHTFNSLYDQQKQIVISSDCPPREIPTLEERLHSRFEWGLIADIEPPDLETKVAILKRKAETMGIVIPDEVALFIAGRVKHNVRELEGSLIRLVAISSLRGEKISKALAQDAMRNIAGEEESDAITIQKIQKAVAASFKISVAELLSKSNTQQISGPRQIAMYLCKQLTKHSYPAIGRAFGGKHHTTVMHSYAKVDSLRRRDSEMQKLVNDLSESLQK
ncbi:MAG: chromosomal replication initiator protein DnaA [Pyrinomonadaceae bacterium]